MYTHRWFIALSLAASLALATSDTPLAQSADNQASPLIGSCDLQALAQSEAEFVRLSRLRPSDGSVTDDELRRASAEYVLLADACYTTLYGGSASTFIDDDGMLLSPDGSQPYNASGLKWGAGSPYTGGVNAPGPGLPGGTVTYSFMASGIDTSAESTDPTLAFSSLPTYSPCFVAEITNAFAAWSAVANIQFVQVADNGVPFNAAGAAGDIRIAAHSFDGPFAVLAHGFYPPPNGTSAAGDMHFDRAENWSCTPGPGLIDIGIVAVHELGHAIGLSHEQTNPAIMQPYYNPAITVPLVDDINGAVSIYGAPPRPPTRAVGDFDGDRKTDIAVWRPSSGVWYQIRSSNGAVVTTPWGAGYAPYNDIPVAGDFDGDEKADVAVWRPSTGAWYVVRSSNGTASGQAWGAGYAPYNDVPVPADYDGDGKTDLAVWRPSTGVWYVVRSSDGTPFSQAWGAGYAPYNDVPVPRDFDGDGKADIAVWRPSTGVWYVVRSSNGTAYSQAWGAGYAPYNDVPVPADFDGDGKTDVAVWRPSTGVWYVVRSSDGTTVGQPWGAGYFPYNDVPVPGDFDGDGKADLAVWRDSTAVWYVIRSSDGTFIGSQWGNTGDIPVPKPTR